MKNLIILLLLSLALGACGDTKKTVRLLDTNEKFQTSNNVYLSGDTVVCTYSIVFMEWRIDDLWIKFDGNTFKGLGTDIYKKGVVQ